MLPNLQVGGNYTLTETMQAGWQNTDPPGASPVKKIIHVPGDIGTDPGQIDPTNPIVYFGNTQLPNVPASSDIATSVLIAGMAGAMAFYILRKQRYQHKTQ